jgi:hypothetical protein
MNLAKIYGYYSCGLQLAHRIGARNIIFFGLLGTAVAAEYPSPHTATGSPTTNNAITASTSSKESNPHRPSTNTPTDTSQQYIYSTMKIAVLK